MVSAADQPGHHRGAPADPPPDRRLPYVAAVTGTDPGQAGKRESLRNRLGCLIIDDESVE